MRRASKGWVVRKGLSKEEMLQLKEEEEPHDE